MTLHDPTWRFSQYPTWPDLILKNPTHWALAPCTSSPQNPTIPPTMATTLQPVTTCNFNTQIGALNVSASVCVAHPEDLDWLHLLCQRPAHSDDSDHFSTNRNYGFASSWPNPFIWMICKKKCQDRPLSLQQTGHDSCYSRLISQWGWYIVFISLLFLLHLRTLWDSRLLQLLQLPVTPIMATILTIRDIPTSKHPNCGLSS